MKIIIHGYTGRMGKMMIDAAEKKDVEIVALVAIDAEEKENCYRNIQDFQGEADVLVDFSNHASTKDVTDWCIDHETPAVICTTGQTEEELQMIANASKSVPVFRSGNMSLGIAVLTDLVKKAAAMFPDADIEIVEMHHNQKLDVPSGTALMLAEAVKEARPESEFNIGRHENGKRKKVEIGIHSLRMGNEVGTHTVYINTGNECLTLSHEAESRAVFADGALKAAEYLIGKKPGLYSMKDMLEDE